MNCMSDAAQKEREARRFQAVADLKAKRVALAQKLVEALRLAWVARRDRLVDGPYIAGAYTVASASLERFKIEPLAFGAANVHVIGGAEMLEAVAGPTLVRDDLLIASLIGALRTLEAIYVADTAEVLAEIEKGDARTFMSTLDQFGPRVGI